MNKQELNDKLLYIINLKGHLDVIKYILTSPDLKEHADINYKNIYGYNALMYACNNGNLEVVKYLLSSSDLKEHADIHDKDNNGTNSLMYACYHGNLELVKYLLNSSELKEHADINYKDNNGWNTLMLACYNGHLDVIEFLLIDMNMKIDNETIDWLHGDNDKKEIYHNVLDIIRIRDLHDKLNFSTICQKKLNLRAKI